jgi:hypothetical protein
LLQGVAVTADECATKRQAVWIEALGRRFCMRYYLSDEGGQGRLPLVLLQGDQLGRADLAAQSFHPRPDAKAVDTEVLAGRAARLSRTVKGPAIYLARVGLDGSSGHHIVRRTMLELHATNAAIEAIKAKHAFEGFHIVGQSGGATLVAGLLGLRDDIACAVMGAGRLSSIRNVPIPDDPALGFFDPADSAERLVDRATRIMVVTDPEDRIVAAASQTGFVARLHEAGGRARQFFVTATDGNRHGVAVYAAFIAAGCMRGDSDEVIGQRLAAYVEKRIAAKVAQESEASSTPLSDQALVQGSHEASR